MAKSRNKGFDNPRAILTEPKQVQDIRCRGDRGEDQKLIAESYGLTRSAANKIIKRSVYKDIPEVDCNEPLE